jgi:hypothetical protein
MPLLGGILQDQWNFPCASVRHSNYLLIMVQDYQQTLEIINAFGF